MTEDVSENRTAEEDAPPAPAGRLVALADAADLKRLESAWMEALEDAAFDADAAGAVLVALRAHASPRVAKAAASLLWMALETWTEAGRAGRARALLIRLGEGMPDSDLVREAAAEVYRADAAGAPDLESLIAMTLGRDDLPAGRAVGRLETFLSLPPGTFVVDPRRKHPGCVQGVDPDRGVLKVSFGESERGYDAESVVHLEPGDPDNFLALAAFAPERLAEMAEGEPARLARIVLAAHGPKMKFREFKAALEPAVPPKTWTAWWRGARDTVRRSPYIEMTDSSQPTLTLRDQPVSFQREQRHAFLEAAGEDRFAMVLSYLDETGHDPEAEAALLAEFAETLNRTAGAGETAAERLGALAVLAEMHRRHPDTLAAPSRTPAAAAGEAGLPAAMAALGAPSVVRAVLALVREAMPDAWPEVFAEALAASRLPEACEQMAEALNEAGHTGRLASAAEALMRRPDDAPAATFWLWSAVTGERYADAFADVDPVSLTIRMLLAVDRLGRDAQEDRSLKPVVVQVRGALDVRANPAIERVLDRADDAQAKDIRAAADRNTVLTDALRSRLLDLVRRTHPEHFAVHRVEPWEEEDVIWTTERALRHQEEVYGDLVTRQMAENAQAIGDAAALGDISENAEFTAALEEQQRLSEKAEQMQADIRKARVIPPSMGAGETVTVGSRVRARNLATGEAESFTFLGPWDTDVENDIYYYRAPLAMAFMGKAVGDTVTFGEGDKQRRWEVLAIEAGV
jgi:transcription elongation GreA/GreB family factor